MPNTNNRYFVSFKQDETAIPPRPYDFDHVINALCSALRAAVQNSGGMVKFIEVGPVSLIMFNARHASVTVTAESEADMAAVYRKISITLNTIPERFWHGAMNKEQVLDEIAVFTRR